jgi:DNA-binding SARP family transcriptional activator
MQFAILGPVEVTMAGRQVPVDRPRWRAVLGYLLLSANRVVATERLIDALWGPVAPSTARAQIQADVSALRRVLHCTDERVDLTTRAPGYLLSVPVGHLDTDVFRQRCQQARESLVAGRYDEAAERLRGALSLWRGPAVADITAAYGDSVRAQFAEERLLAFEQLADAELTLGRHRALVPELSAVVATEPIRETLVARLMLALHRSGRQADALRVGREMRFLLAEREGLDPSRAHVALEHAVLRADPSLDWHPPRVPHIPSTRVPTDPTPSAHMWAAGHDLTVHLPR